ncbi:hypothetical protein SAMN00790413_00009 [Deinococcus hopiensis KR-140]|uniref:Uncharacterized protein n=1 Tax=Deinococcus hopiensis KR-140 TaxID=695939 RepID=A0A1W1V5N2_9DEIO|nr:hypothetical protein SAMN00790413_00009 [Deinococcus hopiensis KR-140]
MNAPRGTYGFIPPACTTSSRPLSNMQTFVRIPVGLVDFRCIPGYLFSTTAAQGGFFILVLWRAQQGQGFLRRLQFSLRRAARRSQGSEAHHIGPNLLAKQG